METTWANESCQLGVREHPPERGAEAQRVLRGAIGPPQGAQQIGAPQCPADGAAVPARLAHEGVAQ